MKRRKELICDLSNVAVSNDFEWLNDRNIRWFDGTKHLCDSWASSNTL